MMYSVLLVDDEKFVRKGLNVLIDWEAHGYTIMGEADNGQKALDIMQHKLPDLVLVDIRMPVMGGLELIEEANRRFGKRVKFIILSGHNEFEYAQRAIENDVRQYILKPIDENELIPLLLKLKSEIQAEREQAKEHDLLHKIKNSKLLHEVICERNRIRENEMRENLTIAEDESFYCLVMGVHETIMKDSGLILHVMNILSTIKMDYEIMEDRYHNVCLFIPYDKKDISHTVKQLRQLMLSSKALEITACTSDVLSNTGDNLITAYQQALLTQKCLFYRPGHKNASYTEGYTKELTHKRAVGCFATILELIENNQMDSIEDAVRSALKECKSACVDPELLRIEIDRLIYDTTALAVRLNGKQDHSVGLKNALCHVRFNNSNVDMLSNRLSQYCVEQAAYIVQLQQEKQSGIAGKVKKFLEQNYTKDINLKKVADRFYVNAIYLGQLFKKSYGMKFTDYLNDVRISEAKKLLKNTDHSVNEIASMVGYRNTEYFIKKFYSVVGTTPNKYRKHKKTMTHT